MKLDEAIWDLVEQENYKQLSDLTILGFDDLFSIIDAKYGSQEEMIEREMPNQAEQIYSTLPSIQVSR